MKRRKKRVPIRLKGYLTVYLTLLLSLLLAVVMVLVEGVRRNTMRTETELAMDTAGQSALAEYHQELLRQYDLFFIDTSYGGVNPGAAALGEHIRHYANKNLQDTAFLDCRMSQVSVYDMAVATDDGGSVLEHQIVSYMEDYLGIDGIKKLLSSYYEAQPEQLKTEEKIKERDDNERRLDSEPTPVKRTRKTRKNHETGETEEYIEEEEVPIENPADYVNDTRNRGVLNLVVEEPEKLSNVKVPLEQYVSSRSGLMEGAGLAEENNISVISELERKLLLSAYIFQKYGYYGAEKEGARLAYQVEYLLGKKSSDIENLKAVVNRLLLLREAANAAYLYTDAQKRAEITAMAAAVAAVAVSPHLQPLLEASILFAWSYVESLQDVKILLNGGKVPLVKTKADWHTDLDSILGYENSIQKKESARGLSYQQYLNMFLYLEEKQELLFRMMDVMEMDIRKTDYNENFRMDACVSAFRVSASVESTIGYSCTIDRKYSYEEME